MTYIYCYACKREIPGNELGQPFGGHVQRQNNGQYPPGFVDRVIAANKALRGHGVTGPQLREAVRAFWEREAQISGFSYGDS